MQGQEGRAGGALEGRRIQIVWEIGGVGSSRKLKFGSHP